jgi:hypothetical protein
VAVAADPEVSVDLRLENTMSTAVVSKPGCFRLSRPTLPSVLGYWD